MNKLLAIVALTFAASASAGTLEYKPSKGLPESLVWRTVNCMREAAENGLRAGMRDEDELAFQIVSLCGLPLGRLMVATQGVKPEDAAAYSYSLAHRAIAEVPGVKKPAGAGH